MLLRGEETAKGSGEHRGGRTLERLRLAALAIAALVLAQAISAGSPDHPGAPATSATAPPSIAPLPAPEPSGAGNWGARPAGPPPIEPGNAGAEPSVPSGGAAAPEVPSPRHPNPARDRLDAKRDLERCATGEISHDRRGRPCP
jgi:hypothetical protein